MIRSTQRLINRARFAVTTCALLIALAGCAAQPEPAKPAALIGAWQSHVQFKDGAYAAIQDLTFLYVFNAGGTLTESSNYDAAPPVTPAYGEWRATGENTFEAKYTFFNMKPTQNADSLITNGGWLPFGRGVLTEQIKLGADARTYEATLSMTMFDVSGKDTGTATAEVHATRAGF